VACGSSRACGGRGRHPKSNQAFVVIVVIVGLILFCGLIGVFVVGASLLFGVQPLRVCLFGSGRARHASAWTLQRETHRVEPDPRYGISVE